MTGVQIHTERFFLRELTESDATPRYLGWLGDPEAQAHIVSAAQHRSLADLADYIRARRHREDVLFMGIFERQTDLHIGNIKFEPVVSSEGYAVMGMLIGDPAFRGKGVAVEILQACGRWLQRKRRITQIVLGVDRVHAPAIRAYTKAGFTVAATDHIAPASPDAITMVWRLDGHPKPSC